MAASGLDDEPETFGDRSTRGTHHFLGDSVPFRTKGTLEGADIFVGLPTDPVLMDGSHGVVHRIEVRAARRPHRLVPKIEKLSFATLLHKIGGVGRRPVLLEGVRGVPIS